MKIRIEICEDGEEELILRAHSRDERIRRIEDALGGIVKSSREITLYSGGTEYYIPLAEIIFFESSDGKVFAHTKDKTFSAHHKLFELENLLPSSFVRISKSAIANVMRISSVTREIVGNDACYVAKTHACGHDGAVSSGVLDVEVFHVIL